MALRTILLACCVALAPPALPPPDRQGRHRGLAEGRLCGARSRSGGRSPRRATPTPHSTSARPIVSGRGVPTNLRAAQELVRARGAARAISTPRPASACCCSRTATAAAAMRWLRRPPTSGEPRALLVYGTALFNGDGVTQRPGARLCLCQPRRRAGAGAGQGDAGRNGQDPDRSTSARRAWRSRCRWRKRRATARDEQGAVQGRSPPQRACRQASGASGCESRPPRSRRRQSRRQPAEAAARGAWRIQLGAFRSAASAEALFRKLSGKPRSPAAQAYYVPVGRSPGCRPGRSRAAPRPARPAPALAPQACFPVEAR